jgi:hypothetical protein
MRKIFRKSRLDKCPFCYKRAIAKNKQGLYVCNDHKNTILKNIKCVCGEVLELRNGKYGPYFYCFNCGNMSLKKGLKFNNK